VAPSRMVGVSASVNLPLHHKDQSLLAPAHPGGPGKRAVKRLWCGGRMSSVRKCLGRLLQTVVYIFNICTICTQGGLKMSHCHCEAERVPLYSSLLQMVTNCWNAFTVRLSSELVIKFSPVIPRHLQPVATLPWEIFGAILTGIGQWPCLCHPIFAVVVTVTVIFLYICCSGNVIIETKFFDGDLQVSVSNVRIFYIWLLVIIAIVLLVVCVSCVFLCIIMDAIFSD